MKIEVNGVYRTRGGWLAKIIYHMADGGWVVAHRPYGVESIETHSVNGVYLDNRCASAWDLVERIEVGLQWNREALVGSSAR